MGNIKENVKVLLEKANGVLVEINKQMVLRQVEVFKTYKNICFEGVDKNIHNPFGKSIEEQIEEELVDFGSRNKLMEVLIQKMIVQSQQIMDMEAHLINVMKELIDSVKKEIDGLVMPVENVPAKKAVYTGDIRYYLQDQNWVKINSYEEYKKWVNENPERMNGGYRNQSLETGKSYNMIRIWFLKYKKEQKKDSKNESDNDNEE